MVGIVPNFVASQSLGSVRKKRAKFASPSSNATVSYAVKQGAQPAVTISVPSVRRHSPTSKLALTGGLSLPVDGAFCVVSSQLLAVL